MSNLKITGIGFNGDEKSIEAELMIEINYDDGGAMGYNEFIPLTLEDALEIQKDLKRAIKRFKK